jgi:hypothetical protein
MTNYAKLAGVAAILLGTGFGTIAQADASAMTCGGFMQMDDPARLLYAHELLLWIGDTQNSEAAGTLIGLYATDPHDETTPFTDVDMGEPTGGWTHYAMKITIEAHCHREPATMNIVERLKAHV